ncbi:hypothetical protein [Mesobacillus selenatarsenatis]|uniref:Uncharacterized protein n=1 Tax=Mesobacillus selenatarsenatis (strain DSM 18680 / JCM 14380 / FERM P-15431 / SF-1) TaxID=1321606 RepID=A0A0A8X2Y1_MESS1|nr:hypothetical protein [Mesobacillus selenatarsenatis]GAM12476.1 hypothetical protein SAMD00020551_0611 [Mesobacillus selenatarsenatis SF-1]
MQITLSVIAFLTIVSLSIFIMRTRPKGQKRAIVGLIFLATSSVAIALALNSIYSLVFFASHLILLMMAISLALKEQKEKGNRSIK